MYFINVLGVVVSVFAVVGGFLTMNFKKGDAKLSPFFVVMGIGLVLSGILCFAQYTSRLDYAVNF